MNITTAEAKMLRERMEKHELSPYGFIGDQVLALCSELLLAAKEKAKRIADNHKLSLADRQLSSYKAGYDDAALLIAADLNGPWGDLFEEK